MDAEKKQAELDRVKTKYGINPEEIKKWMNVFRVEYLFSPLLGSTILL